jgi:hypothetical protein
MPLRLLALEIEAEDFSSEGRRQRSVRPSTTKPLPVEPGGASCSGLRWLTILGRGTGTADQGVIAD